MKITMKRVLITSAIALSVAQSANASITASLKSVCDKASEAATQSAVFESNDTYSAMLTSHFNASSCDGQQLLEQMRAQKAEKLTANHKQPVEASSID
ncbi:hypothetical protein [Aliiglaciecola litoralis]|uniref:DUF3718 domain-containing protein n=1 Tax=Aliiglaciecola litoralis TaxID=582857 RepID=A0ABN1LKR9_9ALTE